MVTKLLIYKNNTLIQSLQTKSPIPIFSILKTYMNFNERIYHHRITDSIKYLYDICLIWPLKIQRTQMV